MHVKVDIGARATLRDLQKIKKAIDAAAFKSWSRSTRAALMFMKRNGYFDRTGELTRSMRQESTRTGYLRFKSKVSANARYALWVDQPTRAHDIVARRAPFLVFFWAAPKGPNQVVFFRKVRHPGTRGALFSDMTRKHMVGRFQVSTQVAVDAAITRAN